MGKIGLGSVALVMTGATLAWSVGGKTAQLQSVDDEKQEQKSSSESSHHK